MHHSALVIRWLEWIHIGIHTVTANEHNTETQFCLQVGRPDETESVSRSLSPSSQSRELLGSCVKDVMSFVNNIHTTRVITSSCETPMILSNTSWNSLRFLDKHNTEMSRPGETEIVSRSLYSIIAIQGIARIMYQRCHVIREKQSHHTTQLKGTNFRTRVCPWTTWTPTWKRKTSPWIILTSPTSKRSPAEICKEQPRW